MQAVVLNEGQLQIKQVAKPIPGKCDMLVKLETSGVCHTDVHMACGDLKAKYKPDLILGHEGIGLVESLGADVTCFKIGDRVLIPWLGATCGNCEQCICGNEELCECRTVTGADVNGTYAEYTLANPRSVILLPATLTPSQVQMMTPVACAGLTAYTALKTSGLRAGQWVAIFGAAGGLGHMAVQFAEAMAFKVIAIDCGDKKMKFLRDLGVANTIDACTVEDIEAEVSKIVHGHVHKEGHEKIILGHEFAHLHLGHKEHSHGVHASLILAPVAIAYEQAVKVTQPGGTIMCVALPKDAVPVDMMQIVFKGLKMVGSIVGDRQDLREALQFAIDGKVHCVVTERPLNEAAQVHEELRRNTFEGRAVLRCSGKSPMSGEGGMPCESKQQAQGR